MGLTKINTIKVIYHTIIIYNVIHGFDFNSVPGVFICKSLLDVREFAVGCRLIDLVLSKLEGNSDIRSDNCLLNGDA